MGYEILDQYLTKRDRRIDGASVDELIRRIDPSLVGQANALRLYKAAMPWAKPKLAFMREGPDQRIPRCATSEERDKRIRQRGVPPSKPLTRPLSGALYYLMNKSWLFRPLDRSRLDTRLPCVAASIFTVEKPGKFVVNERGETTTETLLRVIVDARAGNAAIEDEHGYPMFTLDALLQTVSNVAHAGLGNTSAPAWYAVTADLRHWFHQLPMPTALGNLAVITDAEGNEFIPGAQPMGAKNTPDIGQSACWTMLLGRGEGGIAPKHVDLGAIRHFPPWVPLTGGLEGTSNGGIFVILDNICVVTPNKVVAEYWRDRISANAAWFNIKLNGEPELATLTDGGSEHFTFGGIRFSARSWHAVPKQQLPPCTAPWTGTRRQLASILGSALWDLRVRCLKIGPELRRMYTLCCPAEATRAAWRESVSLNDEDSQMLLRLSATCAQHLPCPLRPRWIPGDVVVIATDASVSDRLKRMSAVGIATIADKAACWVVNETHPHTDAGLAELHAIVMGVRAAFSRHDESRPRPSLVVVITDSQSARGRVERGYTANILSQRMLDELYEVLGAARIYIDYIPTDDNVADTPTRSDHLIENGSGLDEKRWAATSSLAAQMTATATKGASIQGGQVIRRDRPNDNTSNARTTDTTTTG